MDMESIEVEHPLWEKLKQLSELSVIKFPREYCAGLDSIGLGIGGDLYHGGYWCTPKNTLCFASTGGDGTHFSFLVRENRIDEKSPIILTAPSGFGTPNWIVGETLRDFLCLGCRRGYFSLEQLSFEFDKVLQVYFDEMWSPQEQHDYSVGYVPDDYDQQVLQFLTDELDLIPWSEVNRLQLLQDKYAEYLKVDE